MSFANTRTPLKPTCKAKYVVPQRPSHGPMGYYLTPELEAEFRRLYPITLNTKMMELFGMSHSTMHRFAQELHLTKDMAVIRHKQAQLAKKTCERNGYYDSIRGKQPSEQCRSAFQDYVHSDRYKHPLQVIKEKNPRRYRAIMRRMSKERTELFRHENHLLDLGLSTETRLHVPLVPYTKQQVTMRYGFYQLGYILGSKWDEDGERLTIFYDDSTVRHPLKERNAKKMGFTFRKVNG